MHRIIAAFAALVLAFVALPSAASAQASPVGDWTGSLDAGMQGTLTIVFHVTEGEDGVLDATLDSPDQGAFGIEAGPVSFEEQTIRIEVPAVAGNYTGKVAEDGSRIDGEWSQGGASLPLVLEPVEADEADEGGK